MTFGGNNFNYFPKNQCRPVPQYFIDWATKIIDWATFMSPSYYVKNTLTKPVNMLKLNVWRRVQHELT